MTSVFNNGKRFNAAALNGLPDYLAQSDLYHGSVECSCRFIQALPGMPTMCPPVNPEFVHAVCDLVDGRAAVGWNNDRVMAEDTVEQSLYVAGYTGRNIAASKDGNPLKLKADLPERIVILLSFPYYLEDEDFKDAFELFKTEGDEESRIMAMANMYANAYYRDGANKVTAVFDNDNLHRMSKEKINDVKYIPSTQIGTFQKFANADFQANTAKAIKLEDIRYGSQFNGAYQLYCSRIEPEGSGDLQIAFEQLKAKLEKEGLFDDSHKRALPKYPGKIAVITSEAGAAVHDIINILDRRWPLSEVLVLPVKVQGEEAPAEIAAALRYANGYKVADLIITGRGGGSAEDLWAFNDERVARAIFDSVIPVISAVGHEPDVTISDYVADRRASTPSNAAETAVPDQRDIRVYLKSLGSAAARSLEKELEAGRGKLNIIKNSRVLSNPLEITDSKREDLDLCRERLTASASSLIQDKRNALSGLSDRLNALSPLNVLSRGFSFSTDMEGKAVNGVRDLKAKDRIRIRFSDGTADCTVDSVIRED